MAKLGNNPLLKQLDQKVVETETKTDLAPIVETKPQKRGKGRPKKDNIVRGSSVQEGLTEEYTRATFIVKCDLLKQIKDYAYTERLSMKDVVTEALEQYMKKALKNLEKKDQPLLSKEDK